MGGFANPDALQKVWLKGTTDKSPIFYKSGEPIIFTLEPQEMQGEIPAGKTQTKPQTRDPNGESYLQAPFVKMLAARICSVSFFDRISCFAQPELPTGTAAELHILLPSTR
jgi:hypothetical protein